MSRWPTCSTGPPSESDDGFAGSKATEGAVLDALGRSYFGLGLYPKAEGDTGRARAVREKALGPDHPETLRTRNYLASVYFNAGRYAEASTLFESTLKMQEATLGPNHVDTLDSRDNVAAIHYVSGRYTEAIAMFEATFKAQAATLGPDHLSTLQNRSNLANIFVTTGRYDEAIALLDATLKRWRRRWAPTIPTPSTAVRSSPTLTGWRPAMPRRSRCWDRR